MFSYILLILLLITIFDAGISYPSAAPSPSSAVPKSIGHGKNISLGTVSGFTMDFHGEVHGKDNSHQKSVTCTFKIHLNKMEHTWIGFGFSAKGMMGSVNEGSEVYACLNKNSTTAQKFWITGGNTKPINGIEVEDSSCLYKKDGSTEMIFTRNQVEESKSRPITPGIPQHIIFAHGKPNDHSFEFHGPTNFGAMLYDFSHGSKGIVTKTPVTWMLIFHVLSMIMSWGCILPWGVMLARNRVTTSWFTYHRNLQSIGWLLQLIGLATIIAHVESGGGSFIHFNSIHSIVGISVCSIGTLQPLNALIRPHPVDHATGKRTTLRFTWEVIHKTFGYTSVLGGMANVVLGILLLHQNHYVNSFVVASIALGTFGEGSVLVFILFDWMSGIGSTGSSGSNNNNQEKEEPLSYRPLPASSGFA